MTESLADYADRTAPEIVGLLNRFRDEVWPGLGPAEAQGAGEDLVISLNGWGLTLHPEMVFRPALAGPTEAPGWVLSQWTVRSNYPHEPDDIDSYEEARCRTTEMAAMVAMQRAAALMISRFFERLGDEAYARELAKQPPESP